MREIIETCVLKSNSEAKRSFLRAQVRQLERLIAEAKKKKREKGA